MTDLNRAEVQAYLDHAIRQWRQAHDDGDPKAVYYVDAFQSVRVSLLGELLPIDAERRMTVRQPAGDGNRFAPDAFADNIGMSIPVRGADGAVAFGTVVAVEVVDDGAAVDLTVEIDE